MNYTIKCSYGRQSLNRPIRHRPYQFHILFFICYWPLQTLPISYSIFYMLLAVTDHTNFMFYFLYVAGRYRPYQFHVLFFICCWPLQAIPISYSMFYMLLAVTGHTNFIYYFLYVTSRYRPYQFHILFFICYWPY